MNVKDNLVESTLLALQGKLNLTESKVKKQEDVEVETDEVEVTVGENKTIIDTDDSTVTIEKSTEECADCDEDTNVDEPVDTETFDETPLSAEEPITDTEDVETIEVPVEGEETIVPEEDIVTDTEDEAESEEDDEDEVLENKEIKTEDVDPRPNETKMLDLIDSDSFDTKELCRELLSFIDDKDIQRFMEIYEYNNLTESKECKKGKKTIKEAFDKDDLELDEDLMYAYLSDVLGVSEEALSLVTDIDGYSRETLNDILYAKTGYRSFKQYMQAEDPESYSEYFKDEDDDLDESKKLNLKKHKQIGEACKKNECDKNCDKTVKKFSSNTFNEALTNMYKSKYKTIESFKTTGVSLKNESIKITGKLTNVDSITKDICLEMKKLKENKSFTKYELTNYKGLLKESNNSTLKMMTMKNKDNILECKYIITK